MESVTLQQVVVIARQESVELRHYYVGVEHLFMALTRLKGGVTTELLEQRGLLGYFLNYVSREAFGRSDESRYWPDFHNTLRTESVLEAAQNAIDAGVHPEDRALLLAILDEGDSLPIRILQELGADIDTLKESARHWVGGSRVTAPDTPITVEDAHLVLDADQKSVLREMFSDAGHIYVKRALQDGYSGAAVLLVQTIRHQLTSAPVIVKLDDRQAIQYEKLRYDQWVKDILPPTSARIIDEPTILSDVLLGGLKYTFVHQQGMDTPINLREHAMANGVQNIGNFIYTALYEAFRPYWWGQNQSYHFQVWQEYELLLPPALIVEVLPDSAATPTTRTLHPKGSWSYKGGVQVGEIVILENFVTQKMKPARHVLQVSAGAQSGAADRASRVELHNVPLDSSDYLRGETLRRIVGKVIRTRDDLLLEQVQLLEPDFDIFAETLPEVIRGVRLLNPLLHYARLLERWVDGRLSPIYGDLHTGNILMGPAGDAWLIDFEWTRQGHTLFDWAVLEISLIADLLMPHVTEDWAACWQMIRVFDTFNKQGVVLSGVAPEIAEVLQPIRAVRRVAEQLLAPGALWSEYYVALAMCAIRVPSWKNRPLGTRRLMFLLSGLCMEASRTHDPLKRDTDTLKTEIDLHGHP